jgi:hypothetical protein
MAADRRSRLNSELFEQLQIMKATWHNNVVDLSDESDTVEEVNHEFGGYFAADKEMESWSKEDRGWLT